MEAYSTEFRGEVLAACDTNEGTRDIGRARGGVALFDRFVG